MNHFFCFFKFSLKIVTFFSRIYFQVIFKNTFHRLLFFLFEKSDTTSECYFLFCTEIIHLRNPELKKLIFENPNHIFFLKRECWLLYNFQAIFNNLKSMLMETISLFFVSRNNIYDLGCIIHWIWFILLIKKNLNFRIVIRLKDVVPEFLFNS